MYSRLAFPMILFSRQTAPVPRLMESLLPLWMIRLYKRHLACELTARALSRALDRAQQAADGAGRGQAG